MEKISGILPSTPRVTAVDLRDSSPVRAGTAGFGQAEASSEPAHRHGRVRSELPFPDEAGGAQPQSKEQKQADLVRKMTDSFFINKRNEVSGQAQAPGSQAPGAQQPTAGGAPSSAAAAQGATAAVAQEPRKMEMLPEKPEEELEGGPTGFFKSAPAVDELYPKGSFLNTVA